MVSIATIARQFFEACESGRGWAVCKQWCTTDATIAAQAEPLADVRTLQQYADWMSALLGFVPDGHYELKSFAIDEERRNVSAYAVFIGTHTGTGGPRAPSGRSVASDYVYVSGGCERACAPRPCAPKGKGIDLYATTGDSHLPQGEAP